MKETIKGILFDKDGTLIDFNRTWLPVYKRATDWLESHFQQTKLAETLLLTGGYQPATNTWKADSLLASGSNTQILDAWQTQVGQRFDAATLNTLSELFSTDNIQPAPVVPEIRELMSTLQHQGYILGVATMDDEHHARETLLTLEILDTMAFVSGADSGHGVKPESGMVNAFGKALDIAPANILVVGDSPRDLKMAHNAGAAAVGVLSGASAASDLQPFTKHVLNSIGNLPAWLRQLE